MKLIPDDLRKEMDSRIESVRCHMRRSGAEALLVASNANIYYTTGRFFRGYVYIPADGGAIWFVIKPDVYDHDPDVEIIRKPEMIAAALSARGIPVPSKIGLEFDSLTYSDVMRLKAAFPGAEAVDGSAALRRARMVKTPYEIARMKEDGVHQAEVYRRVPHCYKEDMTDVQLQVEIERVLRLEGCLGTIRVAGNLMEINLGSVVSGDNADVPGPYDFTMGGAGIDPSNPVGADGTTLRPGTTVMIDMNGSFNGYQTDMTRVWSIGEIPRLASRAHECSISILRALESIGTPGTPVADLYRKALEIVRHENLSAYFMGHRQQASFIGHGVGIELNEPPVVMERSKDVLLENMTIALEPKFVIPHVGAVGVENTYVVTPGGLRSITVFPEEIGEL